MAGIEEVDRLLTRLKWQISHKRDRKEIKDTLLRLRAGYVLISKKLQRAEKERDDVHKELLQHLDAGPIQDPRFARTKQA